MLIEDTYQHRLEIAFEKRITSSRAPIDIREVFKGIFPLDYKDRLIAMLRAFFDASKTYPKKNSFPAYTIAGFVADVKAWRRFDRKWRKKLTDNDLKAFHMTDFEARRKKPYSEWTDRKRDEMISSLISSIISNVNFGVVVTIPKSEFDRLGKPLRDRFHDNPYMWIASYSIGLISRHLKAKNIHESVMYVFESGDDGEPEFKHTMTRIMLESERWKEALQVFSIMPGLKSQFPGLNAADFLAWEISNALPNIAGLSDEPMRPTLKRIIDAVQIKQQYMAATDIEELARRDTPEKIVKMVKEYNLKLSKPPNKKPYRW